MKKAIKILILILAIIIASIVFSLIIKFNSQIKPTSYTIVKITPNPLLFNSAVALFPKQVNKKLNFVGGVVPHHDVASRYIAELFQSLGKNIKTVILVGTNHTDGGKGMAISGNMLWQTEAGEVQTDLRIVNDLIAKKLLVLDENRLETEHSISTIVPFVKYYLPEAKVVPIILSSKHDLVSSLALGTVLGEYLKNGGVALVGSTDFSHYLSTEVSKEKDKITKLAVENRDYKEISKFGNDNVDSPPTLITVLTALDQVSAKLSLIKNTDLSEMINQKRVDISTSYFLLLFQK